jgi:LysR family glycine cleavage system transcriptional activator
MKKLRNLLGPLRVLDAMVRTGGIVQAAAQLHVTPGAVSQQIKHLEGALGVTLFNKVGRSLEPTTAGKQLALRLADLFDRIETVVLETTVLAREQHLRVKVSPDFAVKWLMPRLAGFYAAHGDIDLDIATTNRADDVHLENADFVIRFGSGEWEDVHSELLFMNKLVPVCAPALAASIREPSDVLSFKLIHSMRRPEAWPAWLASVGLVLDPSSRIMALSNLTLCIQAAADGLGIAISPSAYLTQDIQSGRVVVPLDHVAPTGVGMYLVCDPSKVETSPCREFREWMRTVCTLD